MHDDSTDAHTHHHDHTRSHDEPHGVGHNHPHPHGHADHLHSHTHGTSERDRPEELKVFTTAFVEGFRSAADKTSYLRLAGVPFERTGSDGLKMHLVDATIVANWQIGTASPAFGSRELSYLPYPGTMVTGRETMNFIYVSLTEREDIDLAAFLSTKMENSEAA
ncbi:MAG: hypothetical protein AAF035_09220 [Pseudomonadota bacterium]